MPPQRVWFLSRFGLKTGIDFDNKNVVLRCIGCLLIDIIDFGHYGLKSGMGFKGTTGAYKSICLFNSK